jgi:hypothetical protein
VDVGEERPWSGGELLHDVALTDLAVTFNWSPSIISGLGGQHHGYRFGIIADNVLAGFGRRCGAALLRSMANNAA